MRALLLLSLSILGCSARHHSKNEPVLIAIGNDAAVSEPNNSIEIDSGTQSQENDAGVEASTPHCGDVDMPLCALGESCREHADCATNACNYKHACISDKSCIAHYGGDTCGYGEIGSLDYKHESCCETLKLPNGTKLDKYILTSGRARALVDDVKGNFKGWYTAHKDTLRTETRNQIDPYVDTLPEDMRLGPYSVVAMVNGGNIYVPDLPSIQQGCYEAPGSIGTHTYWLTPGDNNLFGDNNGFDQAVLDTKPLNCAPYIFFAILCAYDGGRLQTFEEAQMAYGASTWPWGNTPSPGGFGNNGLVGPANIGLWGPNDPSCPNCDYSLMNWSNNYQFPEPLKGHEYDYSYFISAPGRFQKDRGPYGHLDVAGNMILWTSSQVENWVDDKKRGPYLRLTGNGSWEGHQANYWKWAMLPLVKYSKFGGRCVKY